MAQPLMPWEIPLTPEEEMLSPLQQVAWIPPQRMTLPASPEADEMQFRMKPETMVIPGQSSMKLSQVKQQGPDLSYQKQFDDAFRETMQQRSGNISTLQERLAKAEAEKPTGLQAVNLRPMLAFSDYLTGSKSQYNYEEPKAVAENKALQQRLQDAVMKEQNQLADDQLNYLKTKATEEVYKSRDAAAQRAADKGARQQEFRLREKWEAHPTTKASQSMDSHYRNITGVPDNTAAGQMSMIFAYMKMLDDGSVVRESEYANAAKTAGMPDRAKQYYDQLKTGRILSPSQIAEFRQSADLIMDEVRQKQGALDDSYKTLASEYGMSPERVVYGVGFKSKKITVSDGKGDVREIDPADLQAAQADGYHPVKK